VSAPIKLNADQLRRLADFLDDLTRARHAHDVNPEAYSSLNVAVDDNVLEVSWDATEAHYRVDDRVGS
jgi:3-dehydroquinate dehydratase